MTDWKEAPISINGKELTVQQSMAVRVACTSFLTDMANDTALGDDTHGRLMVKAYRNRLTEVVTMLIDGCK